MVFCTRCGFDCGSLDQSQFCTRCGERLVAQSPHASPPAPSKPSQARVHVEHTHTQPQAAPAEWKDALQPTPDAQVFATHCDWGVLCIYVRAEDGRPGRGNFFLYFFLSLLSLFVACIVMIHTIKLLRLIRRRITARIWMSMSSRSCWLA